MLGNLSTEMVLFLVFLVTCVFEDMCHKVKCGAQNFEAYEQDCNAFSLWL